jgi:CRISPR-associated protein Cmr5
MSLPQTKEQERATKAWDYITAVKDRSYAGQYGGWVKRLPALILTNGLGQTLAFLRAKGHGVDNAPQMLYQHISDWIMDQIGPGTGSALEWIIRQDSSTYRRATTESLAFLNWLKRFAEAELKIEEEKD